MAKPTPRKKKMSKGKKWGIVFAIEVLLILILVPCIYIFTQLSKIQQATSGDVNENNILINDDVSEDTLANLANYRTIVLYGVDTRDSSILRSGTLSDTIILVSINKETKDIKMCSVYRDTYIQIPDYGFDKVNAAYSYGGAELSLSTLNQAMDLNVTEFATVNWSVLVDIIDAVGGLELDVPQEMIDGTLNACIDEQNATLGTYADYIYEPGTQLLDGVQCVAYSRVRSMAGGDFTRASHQQIVLQALMQKAKSSDIGTLLKMVEEVAPQVYTNLDLGDILSLAKDVFSYNIVDQSGFPFENDTPYINGISYVAAIGWSDNVAELHHFLYDDEDYTPSSSVQELSDTIYYNTGY